MSGAATGPAGTHEPQRIVQPALDLRWLARAADEPVLEPDLTIVDPHHHFSEHWGGYFGPELLADLAGGHRIVATVYVQCGHGYDHALGPALAPVGETAAAIRIAQKVQHLRPQTRLCAGIVGFVDFGLGDAVDAVLEAHVEAGQGRFRGVRRSAAQDPGFRYGMLAPPPPGLYLDAAFQRAVARLARHALSFDALCYHPQLAELAALADAVPQVPIVLNHTGSPLAVGPYQGRRDEVFAQWQRGMAELARRPNVHVKLGGLGTAPCGFGFHALPQPPGSEDLARAWRPSMATCIDLFGSSRCMFESNFPVDKSETSYRALWNAFKRIASGASTQEKNDLFHGTAAAFYRLGATDA